MKKDLNRIIGLSATIVTMFLGIMVIIGWVIHNDFLRSIVPGQVKMKFNVALGFIFSSIVLLFCYFPGKNRIRYRITVVLSVIISLTGLLTLIEYIFGYNLGIDELFVKDELPTTAIYYAGRMSPLSAINFILIGTGLLLLNKEKTAIYQFYYLFLIAFVAFLMLIGFNIISDIPTFIRLAIHVAFGFITLPMAIYFAQPMLQKKITFNNKLITAFIAIFIFLSIIAALSKYYSEERINAFSLIENSDNVLNEAGLNFATVTDFESACRGYVITGDSFFLRNDALDRISSHLKKLRELTKNRPLMQSMVDSLSVLVSTRVDLLRQGILLKNEKGLEAARALEAPGRGSYYMNEIRNLVEEIRANENNLLAKNKKAYSENIDAYNRVSFTFLISVFILLALIFFSILQTFLRLTKSEERSRNLLNRVQIVNKELEAFSYSVSHDLRAPLRAVNGYAGMLKENYKSKINEEGIRMLDRISANSKMMGLLIDDLLAFSRMGRKEVKHYFIDMKLLAESCLHELLKNNGHVNKYQVHINSLPACVADPGMIRQLWMNLLSNALKYSAKMKEPRIEVGFKHDSSGHIYFIRDNGVGFDMKYAHKLFGVFQRLHSHDEFEGIGVGLALVKRIINKHDGDIWAEASPDEGATFYFSLPARQESVKG